MLQAYVLESHRRVNLQELGIRWLGRIGKTYEDLCGKGAKQIGFDEVALETAAYYASEDADFTFQLHGVLYPKVEALPRSEEHTSELQSLMRISYAVFCLQKKNT